MKKIEKKIERKIELTRITVINKKSFFSRHALRNSLFEVAPLEGTIFYTQEQDDTGHVIKKTVDKVTLKLHSVYCENYDNLEEIDRCYEGMDHYLSFTGDQIEDESKDYYYAFSSILFDAEDGRVYVE